MQLKNDEESCFKLSQLVISYYKRQGRNISTFRGRTSGMETLELCFLIDQKYVVKYVIGSDRGMMLGCLLLGIGPEYFGPCDFWSYENSQRFRMGTEDDDIIHNLGLLDEYLGMPDALKKAHGWIPN
jgi:hypothetical protein